MTYGLGFDIRQYVCDVHLFHSIFCKEFMSKQIVALNAIWFHVTDRGGNGKEIKTAQFTETAN